jgi:hypothetical protein
MNKFTSYPEYMVSEYICKRIDASKSYFLLGSIHQNTVKVLREMIERLKLTPDGVAIEEMVYKAVGCLDELYDALHNVRAWDSAGCPVENLMFLRKHSIAVRDLIEEDDWILDRFPTSEENYVEKRNNLGIKVLLEELEDICRLIDIEL